jgi:Calcineurin-like phosphoesterase
MAEKHAQASTPRHKMVGWYDPGQLIKTGIDVLISQVFGARADYRLIESFGGEQTIADFSRGGECWFDFVADLGDGWDASYTVASVLAAESLKVRSNDGELTLPRGSFLIMGGDEVYPVASRDNYHERTLAPYQAAFPQRGDSPPALFAIPGNHDWYDGLISFTRMFCGPRWIGGWHTQQRRSYFAIKLPQNWWMWALDYQLESDIDEPQRDFFSRIAREQMKPGDKVVLVSAEPDWVYGNIYHRKYQSNIAFLQSEIIEKTAHAEMRVAISGDLHHYRRHEAADGSGVQLITSGGGGAFTIGTFGPSAEEIAVGPEPSPNKYVLKTEYPDWKTSKRILMRTLLFPLLNPKFGLLTGVLYLVIAWLYRAPLMNEQLLSRNPLTGANFLFHAVLASPFGFGVLAVVVGGFIAFTDTHIRTYKYLGGAAHAFANLGALLAVTVGASHLIRDVMGAEENSILYLLATAGLIFVGGYLAGAVIMGLYLYVSLRVFRRHTQEAYSAQRLTSYKNFVRFHIDPAGKLTMYSVGIRQVPRRWRKSDQESGPQWLPIDGAIEPELIEAPISA